MSNRKTELKLERDARRDALIDHARLENWSSFVEEVAVPGDVYPALVTGRTELLRLAPARTLSAEEGAAIYKVIAVLIETNAALKAHAQETATMVKTWADAFRHLNSVGESIQRFANFEKQNVEDDE